AEASERIFGPKCQKRCRKVGYISCVPWELKFMNVMSATMNRNSFQLETIARPSWPHSEWRVSSQTADSRTRKRTKIASNAGRPPSKNRGRQPQEVKRNRNAS